MINFSYIVKVYYNISRQYQNGFVTNQQVIFHKTFVFYIIQELNWSNATKLIVFLASFFNECWESAYSPFLQIYYPALINEIN